MRAAIRRITVGSAILGEADPTLRTAATLAGQLGAELHAVHVYDSAAPLEIAYATEAGQGNPMPHPLPEGIQERLEAHLRTTVPEVPAVAHAVEGTASQRLIEVAHRVGSDLVVLGATRQDRLWRHYLGTTAHGVVAHAGLPVLLLRQPLLRPLRRVVFPTDLSELSAPLHELGLAMLESLFPNDDPEIRSLLVLRRDPVAAAADPASYRAFAARRQAAFLQEWSRPPLRVSGTIRQGNPAEAILQEIALWQAGLLVLGTHSRAGRSGDLGSVAAATLREAPCSALVIPPPRQ